MTVHAAKGLEFPHVFLCCLNEGILPSQKTDSPEGMEEERRLAFVALTRAAGMRARRAIPRASCWKLKRTCSSVTAGPATASSPRQGTI